MLFKEAGAMICCFPDLQVYFKTHLSNIAGKTCIVPGLEDLYIGAMLSTRHSSGLECICILFIMPVACSTRTGLIQNYRRPLCFSVDLMDFEFIQIMPNLNGDIKAAGIYSACCTS